MGSCCSRERKTIRILDSNALSEAVEKQKLNKTSQLLSISPVFQRSLIFRSIPTYIPNVFPGKTFARVQSCHIPRYIQFPQIYRSEDRFSRIMKREKLISLLEQSLNAADSRICKSSALIKKINREKQKPNRYFQTEQILEISENSTPKHENNDININESSRIVEKTREEAEKTNKKTENFDKKNDFNETIMKPQQQEENKAFEKYNLSNTIANMNKILKRNNSREKIKKQKIQGKDLVKYSLENEIGKKAAAKDSSYKKYEKQIKEEINQKLQEEDIISLNNLSQHGTQKTPAKRKNSQKKTKSFHENASRTSSSFKKAKDPVKLISELKCSPFQSHVKTLHYSINEFIKNTNTSTKSGGISDSFVKNKLTPEKTKIPFKDLSVLFSQEKENKRNSDYHKIKGSVERNKHNQQDFYKKYVKELEQSKKKLNRSAEKNQNKNGLDEIYDFNVNDRIYKEIALENFTNVQKHSDFLRKKRNNVNFPQDIPDYSLDELAKIDNVYYNKHIFCPYVTCEQTEKKGSVYDYILKNIKKLKQNQ